MTHVGQRPISTIPLGRSSTSRLIPARTMRMSGFQVTCRVGARADIPVIPVMRGTACGSRSMRRKISRSRYRAHLMSIAPIRPFSTGACSVAQESSLAIRLWSLDRSHACSHCPRESAEAYSHSESGRVPEEWPAPPMQAAFISRPRSARRPRSMTGTCSSGGRRSLATSWTWYPRCCSSWSP
jgi:hypothetical protein